eukprot:403360889
MEKPAALNDKPLKEQPAFLRSIDLSNQNNIRRKALPSFDVNKDKIEFMQFDVDSYIAPNPEFLQSHENDKDRPHIRMYGVTAQGNSVLCHVHNFDPYFYVEVDSKKHPNFTPEDLQKIKSDLNNWNKQEECVKLVELVQKNSIMGYLEKSGLFIKIYCSLPKYVQQLRSLFENGSFTLRGSQCFSHITYESNLSYSLRFMIDHQIVGMQWIRIEAGKYRKRTGTKMSSCQLEIDVEDPNDIIGLPFEGDYSAIGPIRILSFDIECGADKGRFPQPQTDPVIQIANIVKIHGEDQPFVRNVFTLKECAPILGTQVNWFNSETALLASWRDFILEVDPDIITGFNIVNFDFPYIINRAIQLGMKNYPTFGKIIDSQTRIKNGTFSSKALGTRDTKEIIMEGRVQFDMLQLFLREYKLRSYTLNSVSSEFLGEQKEDVHHSQIFILQEKDQFTRRRLAIYCLKDAYLPLRLMEKLLSLYNFTEMSRVTGVPISYLFTRGQQIKVTSQLYRKANACNLLIPTERGPSNEGKFEGALVIDPNRDFFLEPIAILDFASLYPSIMLAHNICYSTLIPPKAVKFYNPDHYLKTPTGDHFIKAEVKKGILPLILEELIEARKKAKKEFALSDEKAVLDGRQMAMKVAANSVYGFTGAQIGQLPCIAISSSVTAYGREMIEMSKNFVITRFNKQNGYKYDSEVIYGDTDSVMVKFGVKSVAEAMELGQEAAEYVTKFFTEPIKLEFEKVYYPYLLLNKKRYAGLLWTKPDKFDCIDAKGIETVRRDSCGLVQDTVQNSLNMILIERDSNKALDYCKGIISDLLQNRIDLSLLVISKGLGKKSKSEIQDCISGPPTTIKEIKSISQGIYLKVRLILNSLKE